MNRRQMLQFLAASGFFFGGRGLAQEPAVRIGITPVFLTEHTSLLRDWRDHLGRRIGHSVVFEQSDTYRDIVNNLLARRLDFAWICGFPYVSNRTHLRLTAVPLYKGKPLYRSYLIVRASDTTTARLTDLRDRVFAYADPDSNSGFLVPRYELIRKGVDPDSFFRKTFFTYGHRNAIDAVSVGLADAANVDGYVWETMARFAPEITRRTRVVARSAEFGFPPIVAGPSVPASLHARTQEVLTGMGTDPNAGMLLDRLNLDGFAPGEPTAYQTIAEMARVVDEARHVS